MTRLCGTFTRQVCKHMNSPAKRSTHSAVPAVPITQTRQYVHTPSYNFLPPGTRHGILHYLKRSLPPCAAAWPRSVYFG